MTPKITIFIPTYNSGSILAETLDSVITQTYEKIEILCVDDGSTDDTMATLREFSKKDSRVKYFSKTNEGCVPFSWKFIFPKITGDFTLYMSHDDLLSPDCIGKMVDFANRSDEIDCVIPIVRYFENNLEERNDKHNAINGRYVSRAGQTMTGKEAFNLMLDYTIPGFAMWRTALIRRIGMPTTSFNSDEFAQRLWVKHCRAVAFSYGIFGYRQTETSIVRGFKPSHFYSLDSNLRLFDEMIDEDSVPPGRKQSLHFHYFESLLYLASRYHQEKHGLSDEEKRKIQDLIDQSYTRLRHDIHTPPSLKGFIVKTAALSRPIFNLLTHLKRY